MKILCILPVYNGESVVEKAIKSIITQKHTKWELVIINDGSTDKTSLILKSFADHPQINIIDNHVNKGIFYSINKALYTYKNKDWDLFTVHGADDVSSFDRFSTFSTLFTQHPQIQVIQSSFSGKVWASNKINPITYELDSINSNSHTKLKINYLSELKYIKGHLDAFSSMFRKDIFKVVGYYDMGSPTGPSEEYIGRIIEYCNHCPPKGVSSKKFTKSVVTAMPSSESYMYIKGTHKTSKDIDEQYPAELYKDKYLLKCVAKIKAFDTPEKFYYPFTP